MSENLSTVNQVLSNMGYFKEAISYFNPLLFYYAAIYGATKVYESVSDTENIWEAVWNKFMDKVGDNEAFHVVWILNGFVFVTYWGLGAIFYTMQKLKIPKSLENFKIQAKESEIEKGERFSTVSKTSYNESKINFL